MINIQIFAGIFQNLVVVVATLFTAWWAYSTFGHREKIDELKTIAKKIQEIHSHIENSISQNLVLRLSEYDQQKYQEWKQLAEIRYNALLTEIQQMLDLSFSVPAPFRILRMTEYLMVMGDYRSLDVWDSENVKQKMLQARVKMMHDIAEEANAHRSFFRWISIIFSNIRYSFKEGSDSARLVILAAVMLVSFAVANAFGAGPSISNIGASVQNLISRQPTTSVRPDCDQSATTTDCSHIPITIQKSEMSKAVSYTEVASTTQDGKIDENLNINNTLRSVNFCEKSFRTRQIFIGGIDAVQRIAYLASNDLMSKDVAGNSIGKGVCTSMPSNISYTKGILQTSDVTIATDGSRNDMPGKNYHFSIGQMQFAINATTGAIYSVGGYDGTLTQVGHLK